MPGWVRASLTIVVLLTTSALVPTTALASTGASTASQPAATGSISVAATGDYGYTPDTFEQVPTNSTITVTFTDDSEMGLHTFTIIGKEGWVVPSGDTPDQINDLAWGHNPPAIFNLNVTSIGDVETKSFTSPGPGWYEFLCAVSGHFQLGMYGFIAFGMNLPPNLTAPSRTGLGGGLNFGITDGIAIGAVLVVALVGFVLLHRRQSALRVPAAPTGQARRTPTEPPEPKNSGK